jgi:hypothetical protein
MSGIMLRRDASFMNVVIVPCMGPDGRCWQRFSHQLLKWTTPSTEEVVDEVDAAWADAETTVEILTHDLSVTETGQFDPFSL